MSSRLSSVFPRPAASDADDVVWTLQTAAVQWQRGLRADAIVWVRKAADTATQLGHDSRADELRNHAARLAEFLWTDPEETIQDAPVVAPQRRPGARRSADEAEEILELEELDAEELEFTENDLPTPDDAVADISEEDLTYYREGGEGSEPTHVLPDDLDLRSDSELPGAVHDRELQAHDLDDDDDRHDALDTLTNEAGHDPYLSISPEPDEESDSYLSISPEPEAETEADADTELTELDNEAPIGDVEAGDTTRPARLANGNSSYAPPGTDRPTRPHGERSSLPVRPVLRSDPADGVRSPTLPSPVASNAPRARLAPSDSVSIRAAIPAASAVPPGPTLEELARLLAPHSPMARGSTAPLAAPVPVPVMSPPPASEDGQPPSVDGLEFESVEALADLPEEAQAALAATGQLHTLTSGQEIVLREGAALITRGTVHVTLTYSDVSAARVGSGAVVAARGSVEAGPLRLIADAAQTHIVTWTEDKMTQAMRDCPWVVDDLRLLADRFQAHASAGLGPLGERLDDALRAAVYERLQVRVLSPEEFVAERGKPLKGLFVVAVGELEVSSDATHRPIRAGEFLFPSCVIGAEPAPHDVKAGPKGGLVLFATRPVAHELMMSVPPLLEILAS
ncbi:MAG TPA: hypothetical protein VMG12_10215 [Polyangiaceae bacterium]|nr:hypothetical protein [Polyangiaceae bacterium]